MGYYVYILLDDRYPGNFDNKYSNIEFRPFYVGKGKNRKGTPRYMKHYLDVLNENQTSFNTNPHKYRLISKLMGLYNPNYRIVFESDIEEKCYDVEKELIKFYGKSIDQGILTNIADGGSGGNTMNVVPGLREKLDKISSDRWKGEGNPNFLSKNNFSHLSKLNGNHWNKGRKHEMTDERLENIRQKQYNYSKFVVVVDPDTLDDIDLLKSVDALKKYNITHNQLSRSINRGGKSNGYYFRNINEKLVLSKSKREGYTKPKVSYPKKKIFYKKNIDDINEIEFESNIEASKYTGFNKDVINKKCKLNNTLKDIFRYEDGIYNFSIKKTNKKSVVSINDDGNEIVYESASDAARKINGNPSTIIACCKDNRKKHRNLKWKYYDKD